MRQLIRGVAIIFATLFFLEPISTYLARCYYFSAIAKLYQEPRTVTIYWTDRGVDQWNERLKPFNNFDEVENRGVSDVRHNGQILLSMAKDGAGPKSDYEWKAYSNYVFESLKKKLLNGIKQGDREFEILQIQNITLGQHLKDTLLMAPSELARQLDIVKFTEANGEAIYKLKQYLATEGVNTRVVAVGASNGGAAFAVAVPKLTEDGSNPIDRLKLIDPRANIFEADLAIKAMKGQVDIYNTQGDAPGNNDIIANRVASHDLKLRHPEIRVIDVKPDGFNFLNRHVVITKKNSPPLSWREFTGKGYTEEKSSPRIELLFGKQDANSILDKGNGSTHTIDTQFNPKSLTPEEREGWLKNQEKFAREMGYKSIPGPSSSNNASNGSSKSGNVTGTQFDPKSLTPEEREGWQRNQEKFAREMAYKLPSGTASSASDELDRALAFEAWREQGDRSFKSNEEKTQFYQNNPELLKYKDIASYRSPATEVDRDLSTGALSFGGASTRSSKVSNANSTAKESSITFDPKSLTPEEREGWLKNQEKFAREMGYKSIPGPSSSNNASNGSSKSGNVTGTQFDPKSLTPEEREGWQRNQEKFAREMGYKPTPGSASSNNTSPKGEAASRTQFDPSTLTPEEQEARRKNEEKFAREMGYKSPSSSTSASNPSTKNGTTAGVQFDPNSLTPEEREGWLRNQEKFAREMQKQPTVQQAFDQAEKALPGIYGAGSKGISFGDMTTHTASDGLKAIPKVEGDLRTDSPNRYFNKTWTVVSGDKVIAGGFTDVKLLDNGLFAAKTDAFGGTYKLYSGATGKPISDTEFTEARIVAGGGGLVQVLAGGTWQIKDTSGQTIGTFNGAGQATYLGNGKVQVNYRLGDPLIIDVPKAANLPVGGIRFDKPLNTKETKGVAAQVEKDIEEAEDLTPKKKPKKPDQ